jgi:hypothetical protein
VFSSDSSDVQLSPNLGHTPGCGGPAVGKHSVRASTSRLLCTTALYLGGTLWKPMWLLGTRTASAEIASQGPTTNVLSLPQCSCCMRLERDPTFSSQPMTVEPYRRYSPWKPLNLSVWYPDSSHWVKPGFEKRPRRARPLHE